MTTAVHRRMPMIQPSANGHNWLDPFPDRGALLAPPDPCPDDSSVRRRVRPGVNPACRDNRERIATIIEDADA
ncbi:hypothetical protein EWI61_02445 [Methylolobus aquaticus]|nr:hypothetical protein EWI61_02445 [Methylolobus aquaticus]